MTVLGRDAFGIPFTSGSLVYGKNDETAELSIGTLNQLLAVNSSNEPAWVSIGSSFLSDFSGSFDTGDILFYDNGAFKKVPNTKFSYSSNEFKITSSSDGTTFNDAIIINGAGSVAFPNTLSTAISEADLDAFDVARTDIVNTFTSLQNFTSLNATGNISLSSASLISFGNTSLSEDTFLFDDDMKICYQNSLSFTTSNLFLRETPFDVPSEANPIIVEDPLNLDLTFTFVVDPVNGLDSNDGSPANPYQSLNPIVSRINSSVSNDIINILVKTGTYTDQTLTMTSGSGDINIVCEKNVVINRGTLVTPQGIGTTSGVNAGVTYSFFGNGAIIKGFTSTEGDSIHAGGGTVKVYDVLSTTSRDGMSSGGTASIEVYRSTFLECSKYSIASSDTATLYAEDCYFESVTGGASDFLNTTSSGNHTFKRSTFDVRSDTTNDPKVTGNSSTTFEQCSFGDRTNLVELETGTYRKCLINSSIECQFDITIDTCYGYATFRLQDGNSNDKIVSVDKSFFVGLNNEAVFANTSPSTINSLTISNSILANYSTVVNLFNSTLLAAWQASSSAIDNCTFFSNNNLYDSNASGEVGSTITNIFTTTPSLENTNIVGVPTPHMVDYAITSGTIGFDIDDIAQVGVIGRSASITLNGTKVLDNKQLTLESGSQVSLGDTTKLSETQLVFKQGYGAVNAVDDLAQLKKVPLKNANRIAIVAENNGIVGNVYVFDPVDRSSEVALDPNENLWVAPENTSGNQGAWKFIDVLSTNTEAGQKLNAVPITYFIDKINGSDSNNGLSPETAFETWSAANSLVSSFDTVSFANGSGQIYRETIDLDGSGRIGITFTTHGAGEQAIVSGKDVFSLSNIVLESGNAYRATIGIEAGTANQCAPGIFEDGIRLREFIVGVGGIADNAAAIQAVVDTPGSFYFAGPGDATNGWDTGIKTYYIHSTDSTPINNNPKVYDTYARNRTFRLSDYCRLVNITSDSGFHTEGVTGKNCHLENFTQLNFAQNGLVMSGTFYDCDVIGPNPTLDGSYFHYKPTVAEDSVNYYERCRAVGSKSSLLSTAFDCVGPLLPSDPSYESVGEQIEYVDCEAYNVKRILNPRDIDKVFVTGMKAIGFTELGQTLAEQDVSITDSSFIGGSSKFYQLSADQSLTMKRCYIETIDSRPFYGETEFGSLTLEDVTIVQNQSIETANETNLIFVTANGPADRIDLQRVKYVNTSNSFDNVIVSGPINTLLIDDVLLVGSETPNDPKINVNNTVNSLIGFSNVSNVVTMDKTTAIDNFSEFSNERQIQFKHGCYDNGMVTFVDIHQPFGSTQPRRHLLLSAGTAYLRNDTKNFFEAVYTAPSGESFTSSCTDNGEYIICGTGGLVVETSSNVTSFQVVTTGTVENLNDIATDGNDRFVAVGDNGTIIYKAAGATIFVAIASGTTEKLVSIASDGTNWVAVTASGSILDSTTALLDGADKYFVKNSNTASKQLNSIEYIVGGIDKFIAAGIESSIFESSPPSAPTLPSYAPANSSFAISAADEELWTASGGTSSDLVSPAGSSFTSGGNGLILNSSSVYVAATDITKPRRSYDVANSAYGYTVNNEIPTLPNGAPPPPEVLNLGLTFDYVVDPTTGDDANDGSPANPFETLAALVTQLQTDGTGATNNCLIKQGDYVDDPLVLNSSLGTATLVFEPNSTLRSTSTAVGSVQAVDITGGSLTIYGNGLHIRDWQEVTDLGGGEYLASSNGLAAHGDGTLNVYDCKVSNCGDGLTLHSTSVGNFYRCYVEDCDKFGVAHVGTTTSYHEDCTIIGGDGYDGPQSGVRDPSGVIGGFDTGGSHQFVNCTILRSPSGSTVLFDGETDETVSATRCQIGTYTESIQLHNVVLEDCFINVYCDTNRLLDMTTCFGLAAFRLRNGSNTPTLNKCTFVGEATSGTGKFASSLLDDTFDFTTQTQITMTDCVVTGYNVAIDLSSARLSQWQTANSAITGCTFFGNTDDFSTAADGEVGSSITNTVFTDPSLGSFANTEIMSNYVSGSGTDGILAADVVTIAADLLVDDTWEYNTLGSLGLSNGDTVVFTATDDSITNVTVSGNKLTIPRGHWKTIHALRNYSYLSWTDRSLNDNASDIVAISQAGDINYQILLVTELNNNEGVRRIYLSSDGSNYIAKPYPFPFNVKSISSPGNSSFENYYSIAVGDSEYIAISNDYNAGWNIFKGTITNDYFDAKYKATINAEDLSIKHSRL